jgi:hypothetical protein
MLPVAVVGNVDPQMPPERFSCQCARELDEKSSLPLQMESGGPKSGGNLRGIRLARHDQKLIRYQWLIVAVLGGYGEPVSGSKIPDLRENTGNFRGFGLQTRRMPSFRYISQSLAAKFPTHENREFFGANREFGFRYQGTYAALFARLIVRDGPRA